MMKVLSVVGIVVAVAIAVVLIVAATRPDDFRIERSASIKAPPEKVFALVNDLHKWVEWSPWERIDPALKRTYSGAPSGTGAAYAWAGNKNVGTGRMEIAQSVAGSSIRMKLDFLEPFEAHNAADFRFERQGETTHVSWAMYGPSPYLSKLVGLVFNMDRMVGAQFEQGLANLKAICEK